MIGPGIRAEVWEMSVISLETKRRIIFADARISKLEKLLQVWLSYAEQAGEVPKELDLNNPVHGLIAATQGVLRDL